MKFKWAMSEEDWKCLILDNKQKYNPDFNICDDVYGNCYIGDLCADIQHTCDPDAWYAFVNLFVLGIDTGYGETENGIPYSLWDDSPSVPIRSKTFESFKKNFEKNFEKFICKNEKLLKLSQGYGDWD